MDGAIGSVLSFILKEGGWAGVIIILQMAAIVFLYRRVNLLQDKRVTDAQEVTKEVVEAIGTLRATIQVAVDMMIKERRGR